MLIENHPFETLKVGDTAELTRLCTEEALLIFAAATGNHNPVHLPDPETVGVASASGMTVQTDDDFASTSQAKPPQRPSGCSARRPS